MAFQTKDFLTLILGMINRAKATQDKITDFRVGSVARTLLESPAAEIDELYQNIYIGLREAIPVAIYNSFGFPILSAAASAGSVTIAFTPAVATAFSIPAGTEFKTTDGATTYLSAAIVNVALGATSATIPVHCSISGVSGNAGANTITQSPMQIPAGSIIGNHPISTGRDLETESERRIRFAGYISAISRSTVAAVKYAASTAVILDGAGMVAEYVTRVGISEGAGSVSLYLYSSGGIASAPLVTEAQKIIDGYLVGDVRVPGYRAAGVRISVMPMTEVPVNVNMVATTIQGVSGTNAMKSLIEDAMSAELASIQSGGIGYIEKLITASIAVPGVLDARVDNNANLACSQSEVLRLGTLTVAWNA